MEKRLLADLPYAAAPLADYLRGFYSAYPRCDFGPLHSARYRLHECTGCRCAYQDPVPDEDYLARFYGRGLYATGTGPDNRPLDPYLAQHAVRELMMVVRFLQPRVPRPRVLDFGTGDGRWALMAAACGLESHATDLSDHAFATLSSRGVVCHPHDHLPSDHFDFINTEQVFEHLSEPLHQLTVLRRSLRSGGVIKIGVPHDPRLHVKLDAPDWLAPKNSPASLNAVAPIEHLNHFEPASLQAMANRAGLEPLAIVGWDLATSRPPDRAPTARSRIAHWLRQKLGETYRPHHPLTQTAFFRITGQS